MNDFSCSGRRLKLTFMQSQFIKVVERLPNGEVIFEGIEANLLNSLANTLNFTYDLHETEYPHYGKLLPNNTWTGVVGHISSNKADFALAGLTVTKERREVIDFSVPYVKDTMSFFVGVKEMATRSPIFFLSPFEVYVWITVLVCGILVSILIYFFSRAKIKCLLVFGIAARQSVNISNIKQPMSLIVISWLMTCTILNIFYGNELKASTSVSTENSVNTLDDLASILKLEKMKFFIPDHYSLIQDIAQMPSKPYGDIFRRVWDVRQRRPTDHADIYARRITTADSRLRMEIRLLKDGYPPSKIRAVGEPLLGLNTAIAFQKNFTCQGPFNWVIIALRESGCLQTWLDKLMFPVIMQGMKDKEAASVVNYIRLNDLQSTFGFLFTSILLLLLVITMKLCKTRLKYKLQAFHTEL